MVMLTQLFFMQLISFQSITVLNYFLIFASLYFISVFFLIGRKQKLLKWNYYRMAFSLFFVYIVLTNNIIKVLDELESLRFYALISMFYTYYLIETYYAAKRTAGIEVEIASYLFYPIPNGTVIYFYVTPLKNPILALRGILVVEIILQFFLLLKIYKYRKKIINNRYGYKYNIEFWKAYGLVFVFHIENMVANIIFATYPGLSVNLGNPVELTFTFYFLISQIILLVVFGTYIARRVKNT